MYVQYDCNQPSNFRDLLRKRSVFQNLQIGHSTESKIGQSSYTPEGTTRPPTAGSDNNGFLIARGNRFQMGANKKVQTMAPGQ